MKPIHPWNLSFKIILIFVAISQLLLWSESAIEKFSLYNHLFPGRERFPFNMRGYSVMITDLDVAFASHVVSARPKDEEFRLFVVGDSAVWGINLGYDQTVTGVINQMALTLCGRSVHAYNLGFPGQSLTKDISVIYRSLDYQPDAIVWMLTLNAFIPDSQVRGIVRENPELVYEIDRKYGLGINLEKVTTDRTLSERRRKLALLARNQFYGLVWAATGFDGDYRASQRKFDQEVESAVDFQDYTTNELTADNIETHILRMVFHMTDVPVLLVNQPVYIARGAGSEARYNKYYPRWAYDQYRDILTFEAGRNHWMYYDLWNLIPADQFSDSEFHVTPAAERLVAEKLADAVRGLPCK